MKIRIITLFILNLLVFSLVACSYGKDDKTVIEPTHAYKRFVAQASIEPPLWGVADTNGKWIVEPKYLEINSFKSGGGVYAVQETEANLKQEIFTLINDENKVITSNVYRDNFFPLLGGFVAIRDPDRGAYLGLNKSDIEWRNYGWSIVDKNGHTVLPGPYKSIEPYRDYAILTGEDSRQYILNSSARIIYATSEGKHIGKKFNNIDALFRAVDYSECNGNPNFSECRKHGAINQNGEWVIQPRKYFLILWCREFPTILCTVTDFEAKRKLEWLVDQDWNVLSPSYVNITAAQSIHDGKIIWGKYFFF